MPQARALPDLVRVDYANPAHATALIDLLDHYARDPAGGGAALSEHTRSHLVAALAARPHVFSVLAWRDGVALGLANAVEGFSTFACAPLVNLHDLVVREDARGQGIGAALIAAVEAIARERGACKLTLEVLAGNHAAGTLYRKLGFADYQLDPALGHARFLQKWLD